MNGVSFTHNRFTLLLLITACCLQYSRFYIRTVHRLNWYSN
jgi:hypothetical protein